VREALERRWRAGIGLKRILIRRVGVRLGRLVADKILEHRELGYQIVGFVDDKPRRSPGVTAPAAARTIRRGGRNLDARSDRSSVRALPPEQHVQMLKLIESTSREFVDARCSPTYCR